jgi:predicted flap endonuclease-1-like 5' DNA nuclease
LLACLAGLALGLLLNRVCQQRRHAAQLDALEAQHREARTHSDAALVDLRGGHALALEAAGADCTALQIRLEALETEHRLTGERALALSTSVNEHQAARQGLGSEVESLQGRLGALQATYESRITLLNTETSRSVQLTDELTALQSRHAALEEAHRSALAERAEVAKEAYAALIDTQAERDAARATAAETEAELTRERQAAALSARQTATQAEHAAHQQADTIAALETELAALCNQRMALQGDLSHHQSLLSVETGRGAELLAGLTALQGTHSAALSAHDDALARVQAELAAARQTAAATEAELQARLVAEREAAADAAAQTAVQVAAAEADRVAQAGQAAHQQADTIAALETELAALRNQRTALEGDLSHHQSLLSVETGRGAELLAGLTALQGTHSAALSAHDDALARVQAELAAARQTAVATEAELQARLVAEREAAADAAAQTAAQVAAAEADRVAQAGQAAHQQADTIAALETELAALRNQRTALEGDLSHHQSLLSVEMGRGAELLAGLTALQGTHSAALSAHDDALVKAQAELDAARQTAAATEAECAACAAQAERAAQQQADAIAVLDTELATLRDAAAVRDAEASRQAARATEVEAELSRERQAALLAAGVAAAAALSSQQSHQHALATLEQQRTDLVAQRDRRIAELQALLADQEAAWQAAERQAQELRDAQAAGQSAAQLREQAIQQELALTQTRIQELEAELRTLRLTLTDNDEQLATLSARLQVERDQQQAAQLRIAELAALVPPPAPEVPVVVRPAVSAAATITSAELERLVLAAGAGQQPAPVEVDHQRPDDLKIIDGIGPVNERWLHAHGVHYFWQIASWSPAELAWVAHHLPNFGSRVYRENWIAQAAKLAAQQPIR